MDSIGPARRTGTAALESRGTAAEQRSRRAGLPAGLAALGLLVTALLPGPVTART